jgi:xylan 1,4-beta-xylosidase
MKYIFFLALFLQISFTNQAQQPIFRGDYPDPSILRDGDTYYIVHSSFNYFPGLLIWKSKDLQNWTPVTHALHKNIGSVWAPDMVKYKNKFYIYFPVDNTNYVVWANAIEGPWSEPIDLKIGNIDPGHFTDSNGKRYLMFSSGGYVPLSDDGLSVIGEMKHMYDGWKIPREWTIECFCMEGPKMTKRGDYYYLTNAEGGTAGPATSHMVISARSKSPFGPWEQSPFNPIIRTKESTEQWWSKGHGTLFEGVDGKWWIVYHAYENGFYNMGRQTLLQQIEWTNDGWYKAVEPETSTKKITGTTYSINDDFHDKSLQPQWSFWDDFDTTRFSLKNESLELTAKGNSVGNCSPLLCIPKDHSYTADVEMTIDNDAIGGLVLFYNNNYFSGILADKENVLANLRGWQFPTEKSVIKNHVFLRLKKVNNTVDMLYSIDGKNWQKIENSIEVSSLNHNVLGGFLSLRLGLCSFGKGKVVFKNFRYAAIE